MRLDGQLGVRIAAVGLVAAAATIGAAAPAFAKSDISISIWPLTARAGQSVHVAVSGGDDGEPPMQQLCVDARTPHGTWHTLRCHIVDATTGATLLCELRMSHPGTELLRGQLLIPRNARDKHPWVDRTSAPVTVTTR